MSSSYTVGSMDAEDQGRHRRVVGAEPYGATSTPSPTAIPTPWPISVPWPRWPASGRAPAGPTSTRWPGAPRRNAFVEHYELQPIDRQTNGPQLFYGLRYHTHIVKPGEVETFHDQVGYWLWEPATDAVTLTLGIPRGQVLLAGGAAEPDATEFEVRAEVGSEVFGILSNPFLDQAFRTLSYRMTVTVHPDGTWSYEEEGVLEIPDRTEPFSHIDRNTLTRVGAAHAQPAGPGRWSTDGSLGIGNLRNESRMLP